LILSRGKKFVSSSHVQTGFEDHLASCIKHTNNYFHEVKPPARKTNHSTPFRVEELYLHFPIRIYEAALHERSDHFTFTLPEKGEVTKEAYAQMVGGRM
jgi:hypothetical protein